MDTPGKRLKTLRKSIGITQSELGKRIGLKWYQVKDLESGKVELSPTIAKILYHEFGAREEWVLEGIGPMLIEGKPLAVAEAKPILGEERSVEVHIYALGGAGMGKQLVEIEPIETIIIPQQFYKPSIRVIKVRGDSMEDYIHDGAFVGIDTTDREIMSGRVYAIWLPYEGTVLKEIYTTPEAIIFRSRNKRYPDFSIPLKEFQVENIIGRVKWVLQGV
ncbi:MAG: S24 family peptidase [Nitrospirota bacterium]